MANRSVLIIDDDAPIRSLLATALKARGIRSEQAEDGAQAAELLRRRRFDVVVLDLMMPKVSGLDLVRLMAGGLLPRPPFVFVISAASEQLIEQLDSNVVQGVLRKPFDIEIFVEVVRALVHTDESDWKVLLQSDGNHSSSDLEF
jgi:DNA-binding response OmpR family regulator